jgi:hypothetical protein
MALSHWTSSLIGKWFLAVMLEDDGDATAPEAAKA